MTIKSIWLRRIHKWVGIAIGLQLLLWALSGAAMALLDMDEVAGGAEAELAAAPLRPGPAAWQAVQAALADRPVSALRLRQLPLGWTYEATGADGRIDLFALVDGERIVIGAAEAGRIAASAYPGDAAIRSVRALDRIELAVREHALPIWRVDFADAANSSFYVSGTTGELLERRNDSWRWWDIAWMLHIMDYSERISFNHPLLIVVGFAAAWLAVTGFWLLFRTMWRHDFAWLRRLRARA